MHQAKVNQRVTVDKHAMTIINQSDKNPMNSNLEHFRIVVDTV